MECCVGQRDVSIVATFGVQCDDFMVGLVKSLFFVGWMIGAGALGYLSDRYGESFSSLKNSIFPTEFTWNLPACMSSTRHNLFGIVYER